MKSRMIVTNCLLAAFSLMVAGCSSENLEYGPTIDEVDIIIRDSNSERTMSEEDCLKLAGITDLMKTKAADYLKATQNADTSLFNCAYVYAGTLTNYASNPAKLAARIALLGFKGIYVSPTSKYLTTADKWLRTFISTATDLGIKVYATYLEDYEVFLSNDGVEARVNQVMQYNRTVNAKERFSGISADLEPHTLKTEFGMGHVWNSQTNYGIGKDNDMLLKATLERLDHAGSMLHLAGMQLQEAIWYNYQIYFNNGQLSYGSVPQFTKSCDWVSLMSYSSSVDRIWDISEPSLKASNGKKNVSIAVKTATNDEHSTSLQWAGWSAMLRDLATIRDKALSYESFKGIDMFKYESLEDMWEWINDMN